MLQKDSSTGTTILGIENSYDSYGRAKGSTYVIGDTEQSYGITYKDISGLLDTYTTPHNSFTYSYDNFDRLTRKLGDKHSIQYTYVNGSQRVDTYTISQATAQQTVYAYTYDNLGNITSVSKNGTTVSNYEYDKLGRLIREDDCASNVCWVYAYDKAGNLLNKYEFPSAGPNVAHWMGAYPYVGEIVSTYGYSTSGWKDLLTNYNGTAITYDAIGNPLNWRNAINMTWDNRALQHVRSTNGNSVAYQYNADGIRTKKTYSTYTHDYILDGSTILKETIKNGNTTTTLYYYYDESGISGISYNGTKYSYVRNLQGDVIAILSSYGATMVEYKYDAWGNVLSVTGALASTLGAANPFRYRGYYYDTETGFYYLNSRYYDPKVGRFINADEPVLLGANGGIMGYNMFAYCNNNPVHFYDPSGAACICTKQRVPCNHTCTEYHVYTYTYRTGFLWLFKKTGRIYIYTGVTVSFFDNAANHPADFNPETDVLVGDFTSDDNPNMYVYQAQKLKKKHRESVCEALLKYDEEYNTPWDRTLESLISEWESHHFFAWAAASAQNIDFDNAEEGKGFGYFLDKALYRGVKIIARKLLDRLIEYELWEES